MRGAAHPVRRVARACAGPALALILGLGSASASAHDIPNEIVVQAFVKPEAGRLHVLVRLPLVMLERIGLPKRGPGYLDLAAIDEGLRRAAAALEDELELYEGATRLTASLVATRISQPSERAFASFGQALARVTGPKLPETTEVFWNQGFFDAYLVYPIGSERAAFALDLRMAPGLGRRLKASIRFVTPAGATRAYDIHGGYGRLTLDPRWHQAAWTFVERGAAHILDGIDHLLFLLCLVLPFGLRRFWQLVGVVTAFTAAHSITLIAAAFGAVPSGAWFPPLVEVLIAVSILYMALENILAANLRRRWLVAFGFGLVHGFGFSFALQQDLQFAGSHFLVSLVAFNLGIEVVQIALLAVALPVLSLALARMRKPRWGIAIVSALVAHTAWHWMLERAARLRGLEVSSPDLEALASLADWAFLLLLIGLVGWAMTRHAKRRKQSPLHSPDDGLRGGRADEV